MANLDTSTNNPIAIHATLDPDAGSRVVIEFTSIYDRQVYETSIGITRQGEYLIGDIPGADLPARTGNYDVSVHESVVDFLSLSEITQSLSEITDTLLTLQGDTRDDIITTIAAYVIAGDNPVVTQSVAGSSTISEPPARSTTINQTAETNSRLQTIRE